jgi:hypothetical protein
VFVFFGYAWQGLMQILGAVNVRAAMAKGECLDSFVKPDSRHRLDDLSLCTAIVDLFAGFSTFRAATHIMARGQV